MCEVKCVPFTNENEKDIQSIRNVVFINEQNVPQEMEFDGCDQDAIHVLARVDSEPVGTGRLLNDGHMGRIAVLKSHRNLGVGKKIVRLLINSAKEKKFSKVHLSAQTHALEFYKNLGFTAYGEPYLEAGIEHLAMEMLLTHD